MGFAELTWSDDMLHLPSASPATIVAAPPIRNDRPSDRRTSRGRIRCSGSVREPRVARDRVLDGRTLRLVASLDHVLRVDEVALEHEPALLHDAPRPQVAGQRARGNLRCANATKAVLDHRERALRCIPPPPRIPHEPVAEFLL